MASFGKDFCANNVKVAADSRTAESGRVDAAKMRLPILSAKPTGTDPNAKAGDFAFVVGSSTAADNGVYVYQASGWTQVAQMNATGV